MKKNCFIILLVVLLVFMGTGNLLAADEIKVYVDGNQVTFPDQKPMINADSRTLVPVRFVSQGLGASVSWKADTQTVTVTQQGKVITLTIGSKIASVGSEQVTLDTTAGIFNSRTMVPLRFVSECLGAQVRWSAADYAVYITTAERAKDEALVNSDLMLDTPPPGDNENNVNLIATIDYRFNRPVEPQIADLQEILERRFTQEEVKPIIDYIRTKKLDGSHLPVKTWTIDGKMLAVSDAIAGITVTIWNH